jgi:hypothetical protein
MWSKTLVAIFLALPAAVAVTGAFALLGPGSLATRTLPLLLLFVPAWVAAISLTFLARSGLRAAWWMLLVCVLGFGIQHLARSLHWVSLPA